MLLIRYIVYVCFVLCFFTFIRLPVQAGEVPASKCVTARTINSHAAVTARFEKDIAPYLKNEKAAGVIKAYRDAVDVSWDAMKQPYCGFGVYGIASAVKSYTKSTDRARLAFIEGIKLISKAVSTKTAFIATLAVPAADSGKIEERVSAPAVTPVIVKTAISAKDTPKKTIHIPRGLVRGMRGDHVSALQAFLASYFHIEDASSIQTGYFGSKTKAYLIRYQMEKGIITNEHSPGAGQVGPRTEEKINSN
ncbi:hypothetical protein IT408_00910 [Candidatus Uhrbacteria bacterium]|nr:hypothetical protein [Candidatus Uhrbacteria bacterium]